MSLLLVTTLGVRVGMSLTWQTLPDSLPPGLVTLPTVLTAHADDASNLQQRS